MLIKPFSTSTSLTSIHPLATSTSLTSIHTLGCLYVSVCSLSDPFVQIQLNGEKAWETEFIARTVNPNWEQLPPRDPAKPCWKEYFIVNSDSSYVSTCASVV